MKMLYANERGALVPSSEKSNATMYDIRTMLEKIVTVKSAKDLLAFVEDTPAAFFRESLYEMQCNEMVADLLCEKEETLLGERINKVLSKHYPSIEYLDSLVVLSGELGRTYTDHHNSPDGETFDIEKIDFKEGFCYFYFSTVEMMVSEAKTLLALAAVANGEDYGRFPLAYLSEENARVQIVDSGFPALGDFNKIPIQEFQSSELFPEVSNSQIRESLEKVAVCGESKGYTSNRGTIVFAFPGCWDERTVAANVFTLFMNSLSEGSLENWLIGNSFKVKYERGCFLVTENHLPMQEFYREIASIASSKKVGLCSHCGSPVLRTASRGNRAQFCSNSCKTLDSKNRRDKAIKYAASGKPLQEAIDDIGTEYAKSIERWYIETLGTNPAH